MHSANQHMDITEMPALTLRSSIQTVCFIWFRPPGPLVATHWGLLSPDSVISCIIGAISAPGTGLYWYWGAGKQRECLRRWVHGPSEPSSAEWAAVFVSCMRVSTWPLVWSCSLHWDRRLPQPICSHLGSINSLEEHVLELPSEDLSIVILLRMKWTRVTTWIQYGSLSTTRKK